jgi:hypothetical protein
MNNSPVPTQGWVVFFITIPWTAQQHCSASSLQAGVLSPSIPGF